MVALPAVSIIIPTLNRQELLANTVRELLNATSKHIAELIVVDQSHDANASLTSITDARLVYQRVDFKNLSKARNFGASLAGGDLILFLDDDVSNLLDIVDAGLAHGGAGSDRRETLIPLSSLSPEEIADLPLGRRQIANLDAGYIPLFAPGCNASYERSFLKEVGGFDENFVGGAVGGDAEMSHRVVAGDGRIVYDPHAALVHLHVETGGCRDETTFVRQAEIKLLNTDYFHHKIGCKSLAI